LISLFTNVTASTVFAAIVVTITTVGFIAVAASDILMMMKVIYNSYYTFFQNNISKVISLTVLVPGSIHLLFKLCIKKVICFFFNITKSGLAESISVSKYFSANGAGATGIVTMIFCWTTTVLFFLVLVCQVFTGWRVKFKIK